MEDETKNLLQAILAVLMEGRSEEAKKNRKDEKFLADNGLSILAISKILGKSHGATVKAIQRSRKN